MTDAPTLDALFRRTLTRAPGALALVDPADLRRVSGQTPRRLTYAEANSHIDALAAHFVEMRMPLDGIIAIQLPNSVDFILTLLAAHRAGLIPAIIPQLWRHADLTAVLNYTGACALVTASRIDGTDHGGMGRRAGSETFSVRYVGAFGDSLPAGVISLDAVLARPVNASPPSIDVAQRVAAITFDTLPDGMRAVPRNHIQVIAGALAIFLETGLAHDAVLMSTMAPGTFASLAAGIGSWLLTGGTLALHQPFDDAVLLRQVEDEGCGALLVPGPILPQLAALRMPSQLRRVIALWHDPQRLATAAEWPHAGASLTDVHVFGEVGMFAARRGEAGLPATIEIGAFGAPRQHSAASSIGETSLTQGGTLALSGPMVAAAAYGVYGAVDTLYPAEVDQESGRVLLGGPRRGLASVGGYRFSLDHLQLWAQRLGGDAAIAQTADETLGQRLEGRSLSNAVARAALAELGLNPLIADAFRTR